MQTNIGFYEYVLLIYTDYKSALSEFSELFNSSKFLKINKLC